MPRSVRIYVCLIAGAALLLLGYLVSLPRPNIDLWSLFSLAFVGLMLELRPTSSKPSSTAGSLVFVMHLAIGVVLGGFYGAITAAAITILSQIHGGVQPFKILFNSAERVLSVGLAFTTYVWIGGVNPPAILTSSGPSVPFYAALSQLGMFMVAAFVYFLVNSVVVNTVVAFSSNRSVLSTWRANTLWVLGYDIIASLLALVVASLFVRFDQAEGVVRFGFIAVFLPFIAVKHFYDKVNELQGALRELDATYEQLDLNVREQLAMMVKAIEARDPYTSGHSRRVSGLSRAIASDLGLDQAHIDEIENAALMHDIGKIHEEFAPLLQKDGKLTDDEWAIMKTHSTKSAELVSLFSRFQGYVVDCVRHHHERWDGRGYPDGVAGAAIPLGARIIAIADTIDAMTTDRPYRNALSLEVVLAELNKGRGTQFDASLVELTINSVPVRRLIADPASIPEFVPRSRSTSNQGQRLRGGSGAAQSNRPGR